MANIRNTNHTATAWTQALGAQPGRNVPGTSQLSPWNKRSVYLTAVAPGSFKTSVVLGQLPFSQVQADTARYYRHCLLILIAQRKTKPVRDRVARIV